MRTVDSSVYAVVDPYGWIQYSRSSLVVLPLLLTMTAAIPSATTVSATAMMPRGVMARLDAGCKRRPTKQVRVLRQDRASALIACHTLTWLVLKPDGVDFTGSRLLCFSV